MSRESDSGSKFRALYFGRLEFRGNAGGLAIGRVSSGPKDPGFKSGSLQTFYKRTCRTKILLGARLKDQVKCSNWSRSQNISFGATDQNMVQEL